MYQVRVIEGQTGKIAQVFNLDNPDYVSTYSRRCSPDYLAKARAEAEAMNRNAEAVNASRQRAALGS